MISKEEALRLVKKSSKYSHALIVSAMMRKLAKKLGEDEEKWEIVGLLHDLDYDRVKDDMTEHGIVTSETLRGKLSEDCLYAIKSHDYRTGYKPKSKLDEALIIADTLAGIIEKMEKSGELSAERIKEEIERVSD
jgi:putative nucleotidyltransferase with HDIG domain